MSDGAPPVPHCGIVVEFLECLSHAWRRLRAADRYGVRITRLNDRQDKEGNRAEELHANEAEDNECICQYIIGFKR